VGKMTNNTIRKLQQRKEAHQQKEAQEQRLEELKRQKEEGILNLSLDQVMDMAEEYIPHLIPGDHIILWKPSDNFEMGLNCQGLYFQRYYYHDNQRCHVEKINSVYWYDTPENRKAPLYGSVNSPIEGGLPGVMLDSLRKGIEKLIEDQ
jgi:hypothetical protein